MFAIASIVLFFCHRPWLSAAAAVAAFLLYNVFGKWDLKNQLALIPCMAVCAALGLILKKNVILMAMLGYCLNVTGYCILQAGLLIMVWFATRELDD